MKKMEDLTDEELYKAIMEEMPPDEEGGEDLEEDPDENNPDHVLENFDKFTDQVSRDIQKSFLKGEIDKEELVKRAVQSYDEDTARLKLIWDRDIAYFSSKSKDELPFNYHDVLSEFNPHDKIEDEFDFMTAVTPSMYEPVMSNEKDALAFRELYEDRDDLIPKVGETEEDDVGGELDESPFWRSIWDGKEYYRPAWEAGHLLPTDWFEPATPRNSEEANNEKILEENDEGNADVVGDEDKQDTDGAQATGEDEAEEEGEKEGEKEEAEAAADDFDKDEEPTTTEADMDDMDISGVGPPPWMIQPWAKDFSRNISYRRLLSMGRHIRVTAQGRVESFSTLIVMGDQKGTAGVGYGKGPSPGDSLTKAQLDAMKSMISLPRYQFTIPRGASYTWRGVKISFWSRHHGKGGAGSTPLLDIARAFGIQDITVKRHRSRNPRKLAHALVHGLIQYAMQTPQSVAKYSGRKYVDWNNVWQPRPPADDGANRAKQNYEAPPPPRKGYKEPQRVQVHLGDEAALRTILDREPGKISRNRFSQNQETDWE